jgi:hypothetical protein
MKLNCLLCLILTALFTGCSDFSPTAAAPTVAVPTPTPENYGLYTDSDLQIYADSIDLKIQQALQNNNASQAQELGRKRQELIAEFNRRNLKRHPVAPSGHPHSAHTPYSHPPSAHSSRTPSRPANGLPGE